MASGLVPKTNSAFIFLLFIQTSFDRINWIARMVCECARRPDGAAHNSSPSARHYLLDAGSKQGSLS